MEIEQFGVENDRFSFLDTLPLFMQKEIKFTFGNFSFHKNCLTIYFKNKYRASHILRLSVFCWIWFIIVACEEHWDIGYSPHFISYFPHSVQSATPDKDYYFITEVESPIVHHSPMSRNSQGTVIYLTVAQSPFIYLVCIHILRYLDMLVNHIFKKSLLFFCLFSCT